MYQIVLGLVFGLVLGLVGWSVFKTKLRKRLWILIIVATTVLGGVIGAVDHKNVCSKLTVNASSSIDSLRDLGTGFYSSEGSNPILEKVPVGNPGEYAYLYRLSDSTFIVRTVLDSQADISVINDDREQLEIIKFWPSSYHCGKTNELVIPKDKYIFHVPLERFVNIDGN